MNAQPLPAPTQDTAIARLTGSTPPGGGQPRFEPAATAGQDRPDPVFRAIAEHRAAYDAWQAASDGLDEMSEAEGEVETAALAVLRSTAPTSIAGLRAWTSYLAEVVERDGCWEAAVETLPTIAEACGLLLRGVEASRFVGAEATQILALVQRYDAAVRQHGASWRWFSATTRRCGSTARPRETWTLLLRAT